MARSHEDNPNSIKYYVKRYLIDNSERLKNKTIIDLPAGNGITSKIIKEIGAIPLAFDLFPEYFTVEGIECKRANILENIPLEDESADGFVCQEGIEHFPDQLKAFNNFNRVIKPNGILVITTPNYSNLSSKLSYLISESERFNSIMPPNEVDHIWMNAQAIQDEIYYGHIFLIGIQKLRLLALLTGFRIKHIIPARIKTTALILLPLFYPFILISNTYTYYKNLQKRGADHEGIRSTYNQIFKLSIKVRLLLDSHLIVEFEKFSDVNGVKNNLACKHQGFGST